MSLAGRVLPGSRGTGHKNIIFIGVALGMLSAAAAQTTVSPAMPRIVAELGGMNHYSWVATAALLASAVTVPVVGKLSDMYGRRGFFIWGLVLFMAGSALSGAAQDFWWLVGARAVQGLGMGTIMPLAQTIIGDIISPRERGRYVGYLGAVFGVASITGPLVGGWITDNFSWRWLFYINLPLGVAALAFIVAYLHLPHTPRRHSVDYVGFVTLAVGLSAVLLATSWGGTEYPWGSWQIIGLYGFGAGVLAVFLLNEYHAEEPVLPLRLWKSSVFTFSNIANLAISMGMFGAIYYIPVFAQGVLGVSVTNSGAITLPLMLAALPVSVVVGRMITRTGRYKVFLLAGVAVMWVGYLILSGLDYRSTQAELTLAMVVVGLGLGAVMQTFTLVVQNAVSREDLGVATAATQFTRSTGATVGIAIFGTIMTNRVQTEIPAHLPPAARQHSAALFGDSGGGVGAVLDPSSLSHLPGPVVAGIQEGLAAAMHPVFVAGLPVLAVAFFATLLVRELPLRTVAFADMDGAAGGTADEEARRLLLSGVALDYVARRIEAANGDAPHLLRAASALVEPDGACSEKERALRASREVIRPAARMLLAASLLRRRSAGEGKRGGA